MRIIPTQTFEPRRYFVNMGKKWFGQLAGKELIITVNHDENGNEIDKSYAVQKYDSADMPIGRRYFGDENAARKYYMSNRL